MEVSSVEKDTASFEFVGSLDDMPTASDDEELCPSGRKLTPVCCCSAGL
jgi:hypothetical protein